MPTFRVTFFFKDVLYVSGWTETWFLNGTDHGSCALIADTYCTRRAALMTDNAVLTQYRIANVDPPRDYFILTKNTVGTIDGVARPSVSPWEALLVSKDIANYTSIGHVFLHAVPQDVFSGRDLASPAPAGWTAAFTSYNGYVTANSFRMRTKLVPPPGYAYPVILAVTQQRRTEHRVGRPFDTLRGRRMIA